MAAEVPALVQPWPPFEVVRASANHPPTASAGAYPPFEATSGRGELSSSSPSWSASTKRATSRRGARSGGPSTSPSPCRRWRRTSSPAGPSARHPRPSWTVSASTTRPSGSARTSTSRRSPQLDRSGRGRARVRIQADGSGAIGIPPLHGKEAWLLAPVRRALVEIEWQWAAKQGSLHRRSARERASWVAAASRTSPTNQAGARGWCHRSFDCHRHVLRVCDQLGGGACVAAQLRDELEVLGAGSHESCRGSRFGRVPPTRARGERRAPGPSRAR